VFFIFGFCEILFQVPLEVTKVLTAPATSLEDKLRSYRKSRLKELQEEHDKFYETLSSRRMASFLTALGYSLLGIPAKSIDRTCLDKKLMYLDDKDLIHTLTPLAREALSQLHPDETRTSLHTVAALVLPDPIYPNRVKGGVIESYVLGIVSLNHQLNWTARKLKSKNKIATLSLEMKYTALAIVYFAGSTVPSLNIDLAVSTLFVPTNPNYPGMDWFLWDAIKKILYAFQVTIGPDLKKHIQGSLAKWNKDGEKKVKGSTGTVVVKALAPQWLEYTGATEMKIVWISDNEPKFLKGTDYHGEYLLTLDSLKEDYPALGSYKRTPSSTEKKTRLCSLLPLSVSLSRPFLLVFKLLCAHGI
jgi:hypothetical protein